MSRGGQTIYCLPANDRTRSACVTVRACKRIAARRRCALQVRGGAIAGYEFESHRGELRTPERLPVRRGVTQPDGKRRDFMARYGCGLASNTGDARQWHNQTIVRSPRHAIRLPAAHAGHCFRRPPQCIFPVHRIYCVGRNYVGHAKEMGGSGREAPFF